MLFHSPSEAAPSQMSLFWWGVTIRDLWNIHYIQQCIFVCKFFCEVLVFSIGMVIHIVLSHWRDFWMYFKLKYDFKEFRFFLKGHCSVSMVIKCGLYTIFIEIEFVVISLNYKQRQYSCKLCQLEPINIPMHPIYFQFTLKQKGKLCAYKFAFIKYETIFFSIYFLSIKV